MTPHFWKRKREELELKIGEEQRDMERMMKDSKTSFLKKLKKGKVYYFRVRPVINVVNKATNKKTAIYGKWTKSRKVRVKK